MVSAIAKHDFTPATVTYYDVVKYLNKLTKTYVQKYRIPWHDAKSEVDLAFAESRKTFDRRTKFITWVAFNANNRLMDLVRKRVHDCRHAPVPFVEEESREPGELGFDGEPVEPRFFCVEFFCEGLSKDARTVVKLLMDSPPDVVVYATRKGRATPTRVRHGLRKVLEGMSWSDGRISGAFKEIRRALQ